MEKMNLSITVDKGTLEKANEIFKKLGLIMENVF